MKYIFKKLIYANFKLLIEIPLVSINGKRAKIRQ